MASIEALLRKESLEELRHALHQLKGAGGGYGFNSISDLAARAERRIREEAALEAVRTEVNALIELVRTVDGYDRSKESAPKEAAAGEAEAIA